MTTNDSTFSRRDAIKKGTAAAAVVWTAPVILSSTAHAAAGTCPDDECTYYYAFKIGAGGGCDASIGENGNCVSVLCPIDEGAPVQPTAYIYCIGTDFSGDASEVSFTLPVGFTVQKVGFKQGSTCRAYSDPDGVGNEVTWTYELLDDCRKRYTLTDNGVNWSHLEVIVCGPTDPTTLPGIDLTKTYC